MLYHRIKNKLKGKKLKRLWREHNPNNETRAVSEFDYDRVVIGNYTYGDINVRMFGDNGRLKIGSFCSIAGNVKFMLCADHPVNHISTYPFKTMCLKTEKYESISKGDIVVEDDVWICENAIVLSGITLGQGSIIAAGAVVAEDVPAYAIVAGVPAKVIKYRFDEDIRNRLMNIDYSKLQKNEVKQNIQALYMSLNHGEDIERLIEWMPKK